MTVLCVAALFGVDIWLVDWMQVWTFSEQTSYNLRVQTAHPKWLPPFLRTWDFLPIWLRSLAFYDQYMIRYCARIPLCGRCFKRPKESPQLALADSASSMAPLDFTRFYLLSKHTQV